MKKKKTTRNRQKRTIQSDDVPRQTAWTIEEEIALAKGWLAVFENNKHGNARRQDGFWCEIVREKAEIAILKFCSSEYRGSPNNDDEVLEIRRTWRAGTDTKESCLEKNKGFEKPRFSRERTRNEMDFYVDIFSDIESTSYQI
ncbi:hypothetical protein Tco_0000053 [Tanacetum coccineum]